MAAIMDDERLVRSYAASLGASGVSPVCLLGRYRVWEAVGAPMAVEYILTDGDGARAADGDESLEVLSLIAGDGRL